MVVSLNSSSARRTPQQNVFPVHVWLWFVREHVLNYTAFDHGGRTNNHMVIDNMCSQNMDCTAFNHGGRTNNHMLYRVLSCCMIPILRQHVLSLTGAPGALGARGAHASFGGRLRALLRIDRVGWLDLEGYLSQVLDMCL